MKDYEVFYFIKRDRTEYLCSIMVMEDNARDACKAAKQIVFERTGRNAFRPTTKKPDTSWYEKHGTCRI